MSLNTKFITNEEDNKLEARLNSKLDGCKSFDCLVGYFYVDGFYKLQDQLKNVDKIRILVGMGVGSRVFKIIEESRRSEDTQDSNINEKDKILLNWIKEKKVEIRALKKVHSKLYLMSNGEDEGCAIVGSSNLTVPGLSNNGELNVQLDDNEDYKYLLDKFNTLWDESTEITRENINTSRYNGQTSSNSNRKADLVVIKETVDEVKEVMEKIEADSEYISDFESIDIKKGIISGSNNILIVNKEIRDDLIQKDPRSSEVLKPIIKVDQVKKWDISSDENYVIFIQKDMDLSEYPAVEEYLSQFKDVLNERPPVVSGEKQWYELNKTSYIDPEMPKLIFTCESYASLYAVFTDKFTYSSGPKYALSCDDVRSLKIIQALFSSNVLNFIYKIYKNNSDQKRVKDTMIKEKFPLKFPKDKKEEDKIIELVEELQEIDDKNQIQKSENDLNDIIYELYDLNDNEIQVIEEYLEY